MLEIGAPDGLLEAELGTVEAERRFRLARKRRLDRRDPAVELVAEAAPEHAEQRRQAVGMLGVAHHRLDVAERARRADQRQLMPACEGGVPLGRYRERLAGRRILASLAEKGRDDLVDDPVVERVAGDPGAAVAERGGGTRARGFEAHDGRVARAAAEIADQHGVERSGEAVVGGFGFERGLDVLGAGERVGGEEAPLADEADGAPCDQLLVVPKSTPIIGHLPSARVSGNFPPLIDGAARGASRPRRR